MTERQVKQKDLKELESGLKHILDNALGAKAVYASVITKDEKAQTLFLGDDDAADALIALLLRYTADSQERNVFEKILEVQTKLMHMHPDEFKAYADKLTKKLDKD